MQTFCVKKVCLSEIAQTLMKLREYSAWEKEENKVFEMMVQENKKDYTLLIFKHFIHTDIYNEKKKVLIN